MPPKSKFKEIDATADLGIIAYGKDLKDLFSNSAEGLMSLMVDVKTVAESESIGINISSKDSEGLLIKWLNEIIYVKDTKGFLCKRININYLNDTNLEAEVYGETYNPERHQLLSGVKAATYHNLKIEKVGDNWQVRIIFDV